MERFEETTKKSTPLPRRGVIGIIDRFVGPGATRAEVVLQFILPIIASIGAPLYAFSVTDHWSWLQYAVCALLAFDLLGGIITNATSSAKRWYHREGQGFRQHYLFVLIHLLHLLLVSWLYLHFDIFWILYSGTYLLFAAAFILLVPQYLQRPIAFTAFVFGLLISMYLLSAPVGLEWFLPLFYLKLLVSHLPKEEAYRPSYND